MEDIVVFLDFKVFNSNQIKSNQTFMGVLINSFVDIKLKIISFQNIYFIMDIIGYLIYT